MAEKTIYTRKLGIAVARRARNSRSGTFHIIPSRLDKWGVVPEGSFESLRTFKTRIEAISYVKSSVLHGKAGQIVIHGTDGRVTRRVTVIE